MKFLPTAGKSTGVLPSQLSPSGLRKSLARWIVSNQVSLPSSRLNWTEERLAPREGVTDARKRSLPNVMMLTVPPLSSVGAVVVVSTK